MGKRQFVFSKVILLVVIFPADNSNHKTLLLAGSITLGVLGGLIAHLT